MHIYTHPQKRTPTDTNTHTHVHMHTHTHIHTHTPTHTTHAYLQGAVVMYGAGSFWHGGFALPSAATRQLTNLHTHHPRCWGMKLQTVHSLTFVLNASNPMSLVNDYRNIAAAPNASFVQQFFKGLDGKHKPTLQVIVQMDKDCKAGEQVVVDYGAQFVIDEDIEPVTCLLT